MADVSVELLQLQAGVDARKVDGFIDFDVRAHHGDAALDALHDQLPATLDEVFKVVGEGALRLRGDAEGLREVPIEIQ